MEVARPRLAALAMVLALTGAPLVAGGLRARAAATPWQPPPAPVAAAVPFAEPRREPAPDAGMPSSVPVHLDIPAIEVHTGLVRLGLNRDGTVEVPPLDGDAPAGWYEHSVTPGEIGAAVLIGHVDTASDGPAVFYRLGALKPGDSITVRRADGTTATFHVVTVGLYPKSDFPTDLVYGPVPYPGLRLVTCGGSFDRSRATYRSNVVVTAR
ncbi:class F sortase [Paractinoplanes durhamensis]|uniref:Class F sortase n=1 Tax=Paractinoplanes durhamensis TaxID=113563 RepID=A0ABQ3YR55_9ACTN|nr:class F sortase [Actinoplanes durhamensis]GIE00021.1 hypothetical protein Adu01nite_13710 [Actinoplanes durhamensis]